MALSVKVTISGDREVQAGLSRLGKSVYSWKREFNEIGKEASNYFGNEVFASQGGVLGAKWPRLSNERRNIKATGHASLDRKNWRSKVTKAKIYPGASTLVATGAMKKGFNFKAAEDSVTIFNDVDYFKYHQSSAPRSTNLPRRVMMKANPTIRNMVADVIKDGVTSKIRQAGLK